MLAGDPNTTIHYYFIYKLLLAIDNKNLPLEHKVSVIEKGAECTEEPPSKESSPIQCQTHAQYKLRSRRYVCYSYCYD